MNTLVTGGSGRLGSMFKKKHPKFLYPTVKELDIIDPSSIHKYLNTHKISNIIHLAAMTAVDKCETNRELAYEINVVGTQNLYRESIYGGIPSFIYVNSACIFGGNREEVAYEDTIPVPDNYYGVTKLLAEHSLLSMYDMAPIGDVFYKLNIVRTNFTSMPWEYPAAFTDRYGTYLFTENVVDGIMDVFNTVCTPTIIHLCGDKKMSMYEYATLGKSNVKKITMADYNGPAKLTKNMSLGTKHWTPYEAKLAK